ncbi:MAG: Holliday junction branch migration protein RuvA [Cyanobacteria bacterium]|nr:Holliday junction branch migration protein RuvA [Cyanobacteriota bacterium]MDW8201689.1 Holliday junction branch migration protein RuvA [Cyanobacteriota bacterium SKYGB_h_bin112]
MIGYLRGTIASVQKAGNRVTITLDVHNVGYDIQVVPRLVQTLPEVGTVLQIFTHQQVRDDQIALYGFSSGAERDLFKQLLTVSGIGPQVAIALLDTFTLPDLVQAIVSGNTRLLARSPGVGTKTAERITLELRSKLVEWRQQSGLLSTPLAGPTIAIQEDVELTLLALGYTTTEIQQALQAVGQSTALPKNASAEEWIRLAIAWLSQ